VSTVLWWADSVPKDWEVLRNAVLFAFKDDRGRTDLPVLTVSIANGVYKRDFSGDRIQPQMADYARYKIALEGDIVFNKMRMWQGAVGVAPCAGLVSPDYTVLRPKRGVVSRYFYMLFKTPAYLCEVDRYSHGMVKDRNRIYWQEFKCLRSLVPPPHEQRRITAFLDRKTAAIDTLIEKKRRLIALLAERYEALSHDLLEGIPGPRVKLAFLVDLLSGHAFRTEGYSDDAADIRLLRGINIAPGSFRWDETVYWPSSDTDRFRRYRLEPGDLVIGLDRPWISSGLRLAEVGEADLPALLLQRTARIRVGPRLDRRFLTHAFHWGRFQAHLEPDTTGVSVPHISPGQVLSYPMPLPPLEKQREIAAALDCASNAQESGQTLLSAQLDRLREYRQALITAAVTGQLDIPEEAA
jgi:type I restriction enzyme, S subunit